MEVPPPVIVLHEAGLDANFFECDVDGLDDRRDIVAEYDPEALP
ncbi:MAG: hypothetical protein MOP51_42 [Citricoccus sp.]|nr:hypothetical protein [Citricoccus sp. WCRC_4]